MGLEWVMFVMCVCCAPTPPVVCVLPPRRLLGVTRAVLSLPFTHSNVGFLRSMVASLGNLVIEAALLSPRVFHSCRLTL